MNREVEAVFWGLFSDLIVGGRCSRREYASEVTLEDCISDFCEGAMDVTIDIEEYTKGLPPPAEVTVGHVKRTINGVDHHGVEFPSV